MTARPSAGWLIGWALALVASGGSTFFTALFASAFLVPHAFGGRDGQGAAGLAALLLLGAGGGAVISTVALAMLSSKLKARGAAWAWRGLAVLPVALVLGVLLSRVG